MYKKNNIFEQIIKNKKKSYKIYENQNNIAILDINPIVIGHTLTIPKNIKDDNIFNMKKKKYISLMNFSYKIANILKKTIKCKKIALSVVGLEINYVHVHLLPINKIEDLNFKKKIKINKDKFIKLLSKIKKNL
ncbi:MAG: HIT domain-containing protein [Candidatus Shikimatogenerans bostrichidophilus]|nr:MAG: HIT domain-containing protein [Candidatus Shikimatogenerans bostrichidophilus]